MDLAANKHLVLSVIDVVTIWMRLLSTVSLLIVCHLGILYT